jgi:glycosyltransferase involved in cell wall biosynthesis
VRVLQVSKFYPPVMGGIETVAWELSEGLARAGVDVSVLCSNHLAKSSKEVSGSGYNITRSGTWGVVQSTTLSPAMPWHLARMSKAADVIHIHMPDPMAAAAFWLVKPKGKLVVHWHSDVIRQRLALKVYQPLQEWILSRADAIITTSPPYGISSRSLAPYQDKVHVIPIGISEPLAQTNCSHRVQDIRHRFGGRRLIWSLGRMTYYKGYEVLIQAAQSLPEDCAVLIGGGGELLEHFRRLIRVEGLTNKVFLLGHIPDDEVDDYFAACEVYCMSSTVRSEAYGVAIVEAMAMGKPIVATDIEGSGVPWVNRHAETGLNVRAGSPEALAKALNALLSSPERRQAMGLAARRRYEQEFRASTMTDRILTLYNRLVPH